MTTITNQVLEPLSEISVLTEAASKNLLQDPIQPIAMSKDYTWSRCAVADSAVVPRTFSKQSQNTHLSTPPTRNTYILSRVCGTALDWCSICSVAYVRYSSERMTCRILVTNNSDKCRLLLLGGAVFITTLAQLGVLVVCVSQFFCIGNLCFTLPSNRLQVGAMIFRPSS